MRKEIFLDPLGHDERDTRRREHMQACVRGGRSGVRAGRQAGGWLRTVVGLGGLTQQAVALAHGQLSCSLGRADEVVLGEEGDDSPPSLLSRPCPC